MLFTDQFDRFDTLGEPSSTLLYFELDQTRVSCPTVSTCGTWTSSDRMAI